MRTLGGFFGFALLIATGAYGQNRSGFVTPIPATRSFGNVLNPAGGSSLPGVQRTVGSVLYPGGSSPQIAIPGVGVRPVAGQRGPRRSGGGGVWAYPVPIYIGNYGYGYYGDGAYDATAPIATAPAAPAQPQQPNVIVVYPPAPAYSSYAPAPQPSAAPVPQEQSAEPQEQPAEPTHYLLAFKDRSIYSAVAYWVDGDTIHYFTSGNTHNQASVSLIDRDLTKKLNDGGLEVKLPPEK